MLSAKVATVASPFTDVVYTIGSWRGVPWDYVIATMGWFSYPVLISVLLGIVVTAAWTLAIMLAYANLFAWTGAFPMFAGHSHPIYMPEKRSLLIGVIYASAAFPLGGYAAQYVFGGPIGIAMRTILPESLSLVVENSAFYLGTLHGLLSFLQ